MLAALLLLLLLPPVLPLPLAAEVADPPNPVYTVPPAFVEPAAPAPVLVADIVDIVDVLTRVGFWAPQG